MGQEALQGLDVNGQGCFNMSWMNVKIIFTCTLLCLLCSEAKRFEILFRSCNIFSTSLLIYSPQHTLDSLGMSEAERQHHERIWETSHLVSIPVYGATCHSFCSQPNYPHHKTTGTGCICYYTRTDASATEISNVSMSSTSVQNNYESVSESISQSSLFNI